MDQAHEEAMKEKHEKRMKHMRQAGHDVHNLEANFEGNSVMIETGLGLRVREGEGGGAFKGGICSEYNLKICYEILRRAT